MLLIKVVKCFCKLLLGFQIIIIQIKTLLCDFKLLNIFLDVLIHYLQRIFLLTLRLLFLKVCNRTIRIKGIERRQRFQLCWTSLTQWRCHDLQLFKRSNRNTLWTWIKFLTVLYYIPSIFNFINWPRLSHIHDCFTLWVDKNMHDLLQVWYSL